jgi:hypothetical protein
MAQQPAPEGGEIDVPRWVQVPAGVVLGAITLVCAIGALSLVIAPSDKAPIAAPVGGLVMLALCVWLFEKAYRLIMGRKIHGGLMAPRMLRLVALLFLFLPIAGFFTGYYNTHPATATLQAVAYVGIYFGLRALARSRDAAATGGVQSVGAEPAVEASQHHDA